MRTRQPLVISAEVSLAAVTLAAVLGMSRLFDGGGWLGPLAANAVAAHAVAAGLRRRGLSLPTAGVIMAAAAALVLSCTSYWSTTLTGLPTGDTWAAMRADLGDAWALYQDVVAPAPVQRGFVLASCVALWCVVYVADWAAFRLWVAFEATLPAGTLFLFTALLGAPRGRAWAVAVYAGALLTFLLLHRLARQDRSSHWVADRRALGHRSLLTAGAGLGVVAVLAGTIVGPSLPGADSPGMLDPRSLRDGDDSRVTISPLVDIKSRLVDQAAVDVFQVRSPVRSYWRLTSLEQFDGRIWSSSGTYGRAERELPESVVTEVATETFEQVFTIEALAAIWLPTAYEPRAVVVDGVKVRYDEQSSTLIVDNDVATSDSLEYEVTSASPRIAVEDLSGVSGEIPDDIRDGFLGLPDGFSQKVRNLAQEVTAGAEGPAAQARALQDYLRTFEYSLEVGAGHSDDVLEQFLFDTQIGYCEQFAGSFAAMARAIGLPSRVAVGFTPGDEDPDDPGLYQVRGEYAHAWPEVFIAGSGWVAYEPTPGRGMPNAESYTGVEEQQAAPSNPGSSVTAPPTTDESIPSGGPSSSVPFRDPDANVRSGDEADQGGLAESAPVRYVVRPLARAAPIAGGAILAYALLFPLGLLLRRALRRRRTTTPLEEIDLAWKESVEEAALVGFQERASDTYFERAHHLAEALPEAEAAAFALAGRLDTGMYSAEGVTDQDADTAHAAGKEIRAAARALAPRLRRLRRWFDPRSLVAGWRRERRARQRRITLTARGDLEQERELVGSPDRG